MGLPLTSYPRTLLLVCNDKGFHVTSISDAERLLARILEGARLGSAGWQHWWKVRRLTVVLAIPFQSMGLQSTFIMEDLTDMLIFSFSTQPVFLEPYLDPQASRPLWQAERGSNRDGTNVCKVLAFTSYCVDYHLTLLTKIAQNDALFIFKALSEIFKSSQT